MANATAVQNEMGYPVRHQPYPVPADNNMYAAANSGSDAVVTINAPAKGTGQMIVVDRVDWSYGAAPTSGKQIIITDGTTTLALDIIAGGQGTWDVGRVFAKETQVTVTLKDGTVANKVHVRAYLIT